MIGIVVFAFLGFRGEDIKMNHKLIKEKMPILIAVIIGIICFLSIYGMAPLNVTNDQWIITGYDETDIAQHYAGWLAFRNSEWSFPIGLADQMGIGVGTAVSYTDSIPIVAIFFKAINFLLPTTFQYFGIYTLLCYIFQGIAGYKVIFYKTKDIKYSLIGACFFCLSPILMERAFRHTALGSQWLILFAIYTYLRYRDTHEEKQYIWYLVLEVLAIGIHPYFLPMVAIFALLSVISDLKQKKYLSIVYYIASLIITYCFGVIIGALGGGISTSRWGYGTFSMNINALINPSSVGGYIWSNFVKVRPQILGNYDGFNYLGLGIIFGLGLIVVLLIIDRKIYKDFFKKNYLLILGCIFLTAFAISNVVTLDDIILIDIVLPEPILNLCGIFRASSRMFYPVYYLIFIFLIYSIWKYRENILKKKYLVILGVLLILQIADLSQCIYQKHTAMNEKSSTVGTFLDDTFLMKIGKESDILLLDTYELDNKALAVWAFKNNLSTYYTLAIAGDYTESYNRQNQILEEIKQTGEFARYIICTSDEQVADIYRSLGATSYEINETIFLFDDGTDSFSHQSKLYSARAANFTDENWNSGILRYGDTILFNYDESLYNVLNNARLLRCNDNLYEIISVDYDETWIRVTVNKKADLCQYPAQIVIET